MSAAEDKDADSEENGKFDSLKQYPFLTCFLVLVMKSVDLNIIHLIITFKSTVDAFFRDCV